MLINIKAEGRRGRRIVNKRFNLIHFYVIVIVSSAFLKIFIAIPSLRYNANAKLMGVFRNTLQVIRGSVIGRYGIFLVKVEKRLFKSESR